MASSDEVKTTMRARLRTDNFVNLLKAGEQWNLMPMKFYYFDESQVDIATKNVMGIILFNEKKTLTDAQYAQLRKQNDLATVVNDVIDSISAMSVEAKPIEVNL